MEYLDKIKSGTFILVDILRKIEDECLTPDQAIMRTLDQYEHEGNWPPLDIRNSLWGTRHLINTTLRMFYARHPELPSDQKAFRQLTRQLKKIRMKYFKEGES